MTIYLSEKDAARAGLVKGKKKKLSAKDARADIPRASAGEGDRTAALMRLAIHGFWPRWRNGIGHDFWHLDGRTTPLCASYAAAVMAAEKELR
jgi:hypothetical protein